jgi:6-phosphogluconolactonase
MCGYWLASGYSADKGNDLLLLSMDNYGSLEIKTGLRIGRNPSFLCPGEDGVYAAQEYDSGASVLFIKGDGGRLYIDSQISIDGCSGLCHLLASRETVVGCCYGSGDVFAADAALTKVLWMHRNASDSQAQPHAHWSAEVYTGFPERREALQGAEKTLCVADLGLDMLLWRRAADGELLGSTAIEAGSGPRQVILSESRKSAYIIGELNSTVSILDISGTPNVISELRTTERGITNYPGAACLSSSGVLYVANRGADTIAAIDVNTAEPHVLFESGCGGSWPRWITLSEKEDYLICCNQKSGNVTSLRITKNSLVACSSAALANASCAVAAGHIV